jgi:hypothetical protein
MFGQQDIDSSSHSMTSNAPSVMDASIRSHHNFLQGRDKDLDMESDNWPAPMSLGDDEDEDTGDFCD